MAERAEVMAGGWRCADWQMAEAAAGVAVAKQLAANAVSEVISVVAGELMIGRCGDRQRDVVSGGELAGRQVLGGRSCSRLLYIFRERKWYC